MKNTILTFKEAKREKRKLAMLTAYDYSTARLMDEAGINGILVGDSLGMVVLGHKDTLQVTIEDMIYHTRAVSRGVKNALIVSDMPFMSYQTSVYDAVSNAGRLVKEGHACAVKLEGSSVICPKVRAIVETGIPVMAHIGLTPQAINALGGYKVQGNDLENARKLIESAKELEEAGAFAIVLECIPSRLAEVITQSISIPTIGIGAGNNCDGQVLVYQDMLGMFPDFTPRFVKCFSDIGAQMNAAFSKYKAEVEKGDFPAPEHGFSMAEAVIEKLY